MKYRTNSSALFSFHLIKKSSSLSTSSASKVRTEKSLGGSTYIPIILSPIMQNNVAMDVF